MPHDEFIDNICLWIHCRITQIRITNIAHIFQLASFQLMNDIESSWEVDFSTKTQSNNIGGFRISQHIYQSISNCANYRVS